MLLPQEITSTALLGICYYFLFHVANHSSFNTYLSSLLCSTVGGQHCAQGRFLHWLSTGDGLDPIPLGVQLEGRHQAGKGVAENAFTCVSEADCKGQAQVPWGEEFLSCL